MNRGWEKGILLNALQRAGNSFAGKMPALRIATILVAVGDGWWKKKGSWGW
ncbi:MAG: hypothetical protein ACLFUS_04570 [Candidatus Sumerlaeia bacterium]